MTFSHSCLLRVSICFFPSLTLTTPHCLSVFIPDNSEGIDH